MKNIFYHHLLNIHSFLFSFLLYRAYVILRPINAFHANNYRMTNLNALFCVYYCSKKVANAVNSPNWKPHGRNRSTSSVKLDPIHRKGIKKKKSSAKESKPTSSSAPAAEDTDEGFCSNGSSSSSTSHALLICPKVMVTQATPIPSHTGTPTSCQSPTKFQVEELNNDELDPSVVMTTMIKELMHDVLLDVRLDFTDEGIELI